MPIITKDQRVHIVTTRGQLDRWKASADSEGLTLSEWLRRAAQERLQPARASYQERAA